MTPNNAARAHAQSLRAIASHFAGRASPATEAAMRAHLPTCDTCRRSYERHLWLARLDSRMPAAQLRIARGLGLAEVPLTERGTRMHWVGAALPLAAAMCLALIVVVRDREHGQVVEGFAARGSEQQADARAPGAWMYRIQPHGRSELVGSTISASDELAFAYSNPTDEPYLMIFGVDEHRHVYWFHPTWPVGEPAPSAVRAVAGSAVHELPQATRHQLDGSRLEVFTLWLDRSLTVHAVEDWVRSGTGIDNPRALSEQLLWTRRSLRVQP